MRYEFSGFLEQRPEGTVLFNNRRIPSAHIVFPEPLALVKDRDPAIAVVLTGSDVHVNPGAGALWREMFRAALQGGQSEVTASGIAVRAVEFAIEKGYL